MGEETHTWAGDGHCCSPAPSGDRMTDGGHAIPANLVKQFTIYPGWGEPCEVDACDDFHEMRSVVALLPGPFLSLDCPGVAGLLELS